MKEYVIRRASAPFDFRNAGVLSIDCLLWSPKVPIRAEGRICYDDQALYVKLSAVEPYIRAELTGVLDSPCDDSCLEFFFCPDPEDRRYFNIEFNPNGCMYLGFGSGIHDLIRLVPEECPIHPEVLRKEGAWEITYAVPYTFVRQFFPGFRPVSGGSIRANCYKCGDRTVQPHYLSWSPITSPTPAFHRPEDYGLMRFE